MTASQKLLLTAIRPTGHSETRSRDPGLESPRRLRGRDAAQAVRDSASAEL